MHLLIILVCNDVLFVCMRHTFNHIYKVCSKSIEAEAVFTKTEMSND